MWHLQLWACFVSGDISIAFANMNKSAQIYMSFRGYSVTDPYGDSWETDTTRLFGNISVFSDKYDLQVLGFDYRANINGEIKSLKNLKKLYIVNFDHGSVTGTKADLYNNGANIIDFYV